MGDEREAKAIYRIWNSRRQAIPAGAEVYYLGPDGTISQGRVMRNRQVFIHGARHLGPGFKAVVQTDQGGEVVPLLVALVDDPEGAAELSRIVREAPQ
jgi:hypothetical protein